MRLRIRLLRTQYQTYGFCELPALSIAKVVANLEKSRSQKLDLAMQIT